MTPTKRTPELIERILERVASGVLLAKVLRQPDIGITAANFYAWRRADPELDEAVKAAQLHGYDVIAAESLDIVDGLAPTPGVPTEATRDKARADHRLKLLARFDPKRYGEKVQVADADGEKLEASPLVLEVMALLRPAPAPTATLGPNSGPLTAIEAQPVPEPRETR